jgi:hypothetical protein
MKAIAATGFVLAALGIILGLIVSFSEATPYYLFVGLGSGFTLILLSTLVLCVIEIRDILLRKWPEPEQEPQRVGRTLM